MFAQHVQGCFFSATKRKGESRRGRTERPGGRDTGVEQEKNILQVLVCAVRSPKV